MMIIICSYVSLFLKICCLWEVFSEIFADELLSCTEFDSKELAGAMDGVQMKWDWLCSKCIEASDAYMEVIILWIIIIWFPWLLYVIEIAHNKLKLQGKLAKTLSYRTRV